MNTSIFGSCVQLHTGAAVRATSVVYVQRRATAQSPNPQVSAELTLCHACSKFNRLQTHYKQTLVTHYKQMLNLPPINLTVCAKTIARNFL